jgi:uncharacterized protein (TIGR00645 family)
MIDENKSHESDAKNPLAKRWIENFLFSIKWVLPIFYAGLAAVLLVYGWAYIKEIFTIVTTFSSMSADKLKLTALDAIDVVMIANLIKMIITGSYNSFVSKLHGRANENISSGTLKVKIATSIVTLSMIHLLKLFIDSTPLSSQELHKCVVIFVLFLVSAVVLGLLEFMHVKAEVLERNKE